jgi:hypothetical protein
VGLFGGSILLGNGDGAFQPAIDFNVGGLSLTTGDFNRDGKLDLFVPGAILLANGDGTFQILCGQMPVR